MTTEGLKRKLSAILSADVKDYSRLMRDDEAATIRTLNVYREERTKLIQQHHGRVVDFASPVLPMIKSRISRPIFMQGIQ